VLKVPLNPNQSINQSINRSISRSINQSARLMRSKAKPTLTRKSRSPLLKSALRGAIGQILIVRCWTPTNRPPLVIGQSRSKRQNAKDPAI